MAELELSAGSRRHKNSLSRRKKSSTRVDLTPMVDLGFLLITFFMVTTAWTKPHATQLIMPANGDPTQLSDQAALTVLLGKADKVFYYSGNFSQSLGKGTSGMTGYSEKDGIGEIIRQKQMDMDRRFKGGRRELMVLIKPSAESSYKNVISLLDEMLINGVSRYAILDMAEDEKKWLADRIR